MSSLGVGGIAFGCVFGGALVGLFIRPKLREHHLGSETKDVVKMAAGLIATMTALALGLLVASAKGSFDTQRSEIAQMSANVVLLDRVLAHYGPEAKGVRDVLRDRLEHLIAQLWAADGSSRPSSASASEVVFDSIQQLIPKNDAQRSLQAQATKITVDLAQTRWLLVAQRGSAISMPLVAVVVFWLTITFMSFALFAPRNSLVLASLLVCALSVAAALSLVVELDTPFQGLLQISSEPMRNALAQIGREGPTESDERHE